MPGFYFWVWSDPPFSPSPLQRFLQDPYTAAFGGFSKVTNFFRGALHHEDGTAQRALGDPSAGLEDEPGFEVITCVSVPAWLGCLVGVPAWLGWGRSLGQCQPMGCQGGRGCGWWVVSNRWLPQQVEVWLGIMQTSGLPWQVGV